MAKFKAGDRVKVVRNMFGTDEHVGQFFNIDSVHDNVCVINIFFPEDGDFVPQGFMEDELELANDE